jgi:hypothetical protein
VKIDHDITDLIFKEIQYQIRVEQKRLEDELLVKLATVNRIWSDDLTRSLYMPRQVNVIAEGNDLVIFSPYDAGFVAEIKTNIPVGDRIFDRDKVAWVIGGKHSTAVKDLIFKYYQQVVTMPDVKVQDSPIIKWFEVRYIGQSLSRDNGEKYAFGKVNDSWVIVFPESVLREYFHSSGEKPTEQDSLYSMLGLSLMSNTNDIKSAYWRMAKQWHPDVCKEKDAQAVFMRINHAYEILNNPAKRVRYDAGLALQNTLDKKYNKEGVEYNGYRAPLRCGNIQCEGQEAASRFTVSKILQWQDIKNDKGLTLTVSWVNDKAVETWI